MNRNHVIEALRAADWSNTPIGNKALIQAAIEYLEAQPSSAFRPARVIGYRPGMGEVTVYVAGGVPGYMNIDDTVYVSDRAPVEQVGGDERAAFFKHLIGRHPAHETEIVRVLEHNYAAWKAWQARAALARVAELEMILRELNTSGLMQFSTTDEEKAVQAALSGAQAQHSVPIAHEFKRALGLVVAVLEADGDRPTSKYALSELKKVLAAAPGKEVPQAWLDVQAERRRQVEAEGWTPEHDDEHNGGELADAAACYALWAGGINPGNWREFWPWAPEWLKHSEPRRMLVKAAALILAEIQRLDRAAAAGKEVGHE